MKVKICGQTSVKDARMSIGFGADFLGVVLEVDWSLRSLSVDEAFPIFDEFGDKTFLLTFNRSMDDRFLGIIEKFSPYALQLTGEEAPKDVARLKKSVKALLFKSIHLAPENEKSGGENILARAKASIKEYESAGAHGFIIDTATGGKFGGTGVKNDWSLAAKLTEATVLPVFLAGGINPENVSQAAQTPGIYGIDLASGAESSAGKKSEEKLKALFKNYNMAVSKNV